MLVLVLAQTAMPTAVYAKGFGSHGPSPGHGTYFGGSPYPPARFAPSWGWSRPIYPQPWRGGGYVPGPYYYRYYNPYYYPYYNYRQPQ
jgi:hypothetical protein